MTLDTHQQGIFNASHDTVKQRLSKDVSLLTLWLLEKTPEMAKKGRNDKDARFWSNELLDWLDPIRLHCESMPHGGRWRKLIEGYAVDLTEIIFSHARKYPDRFDFMVHKTEVESKIDLRWQHALKSAPLGL